MLSNVLCVVGADTIAVSAWSAWLSAALHACVTSLGVRCVLSAGTSTAASLSKYASACSADGIAGAWAHEAASAATMNCATGVKFFGFICTG